MVNVKKILLINLINYSKSSNLVNGLVLINIVLKYLGINKKQINIEKTNNKEIHLFEDYEFQNKELKNIYDNVGNIYKDINLYNGDYKEEMRDYFEYMYNFIKMLDDEPKKIKAYMTEDIIYNYNKYMEFTNEDKINNDSFFQSLLHTIHIIDENTCSTYIFNDLKQEDKINKNILKKLEENNKNIFNFLKIIMKKSFKKEKTKVEVVRINYNEDEFAPIYKYKFLPIYWTNEKIENTFSENINEKIEDIDFKTFIANILDINDNKKVVTEETIEMLNKYIHIVDYVNISPRPIYSYTFNYLERNKLKNIEFSNFINYINTFINKMLEDKKIEFSTSNVGIEFFVIEGEGRWKHTDVYTKIELSK